MKLKDYYQNLLNENDSHMYADNHTIDSVKDVNFDKADDYIKIDIQTGSGKQINLVTKYSEFKKWFIQNIDKHKDVFKAFAEEFMNHSQETQAPESVNEIVDDEGNIMASTDKPKNTTNSHVGLNNTWDLDKVYKSNIPKSMRYYSGYFGTGIVTW